ncbi:hypothetical protein WJX75_005505 [Coccomyxa subellipsoidea]|uniref:Protein kinase domain-containing protein n=1 Tax=Coccomyxa subellipsoidea TaxID=248742 RepID=A0ABR2YI31_9CHLO
MGILIDGRHAALYVATKDYYGRISYARSKAFSLDEGGFAMMGQLIAADHSVHGYAYPMLGLESEPEIVGALGHGRCSDVFLASDDGEEVAMKVFVLEKDGALDAFKLELSNLEKITDPMHRHATLPSLRKWSQPDANPTLRFAAIVTAPVTKPLIRGDLTHAFASTGKPAIIDFGDARPVNTQTCSFEEVWHFRVTLRFASNSLLVAPLSESLLPPMHLTASDDWMALVHTFFAILHPTAVQRLLNLDNDDYEVGLLARLYMVVQSLAA